MFQRLFSLSFLMIMLLFLIGCSRQAPAQEEPEQPKSLPATLTPAPEVPTIDVIAPTLTVPPPTVEQLPTPTSSLESTSVSAGGNRPRIAVGSKGFTEQLLLGKMLVLLLEHAGYEVEDKTGFGDTPLVRDALEKGQIDVYWEYTGTALSIIHGLGVDGLPPEPERSFALAQDLDDNLGLVWLEPARFNDTYTLLVEQSTIDQGITSIEELASFMNANGAPLKLCVEQIFYSRADGLQNLQQHYEFSFKEENVLLMELVQTYEGLRDGRCEVAEGYSTDGRIRAWNFVNLRDSRQFFPAYHPAPVVLQETLNTHPELESLLNQIGPQLDEQIITELNARVDLGRDGIPASGDEEALEAVAKEFLVKAGLLGTRPQLAVGSKDHTEQLILGQMLVLMLEDAGYQVVDKTGLGDTPIVRDALERGEIDLYWEYTGTALSVIHDITVQGVPTDPQRGFELIKDLDEKEGIVWLEAANFNNTYTLMVQQDTINQGITSIDELASFMNGNNAPLKICVESIFYSRADGLPNLQQHYGFNFKEDNVRLMELAQTYEGLRDGTCEVAEGYSTDGRISAWGFANLLDSRQFFPAYNPAPTTRQEVLQAHPELAALLGQIGPLLDEQTISLLNARVDVGPDGIRNSGDELSTEQVAQTFLEEAGLLGYSVAESSPPPEPETQSPSCENILVNGNFENQTGWDLAGAITPIYSAQQVYEGNMAIQVGLLEPGESGHSAANTEVSLPPNATSATLSFWYYPTSLDLIGGDAQGVFIYDDTFTFARKRLWWEIENQPTWQQQSHDLSAFIGQEINLHFVVVNDEDIVPTAMFLDEVRLEVCYGG